MSILDAFYTCISAESADPETITVQQQLDELDRELHARRAAYPRRIQNGQLSQEEADYHLAEFQVLVDDARARQALIVWHDGGKQAEAWAALQRLDARVADHMTRWTWSDLVAGLRREIDLRRRGYPRWIAKGSLTKDDARHRLERLEAVHFKWWRLGHHYMPDQLAREPWTASALQWEIFCAAYRPHRNRFDPAGQRGEYLGRPKQAQAEQQEALAI